MIAALMASWRIWLGIGAVVAVVAAGLAYHHSIYMDGDTAGYARRNREAVETEKLIAAQVEKRHAADLAAANTETARLQSVADADALKHQQENDRHEADIKNHVAAALAKRERLYIATGPSASCPVRDQATPKGSAAGTGPGDETRTEIMPDAAAAIYRIAGDSAQLVRDYNTVVDRYDKIRTSCNAE